MPSQSPYLAKSQKIKDSYGEYRTLLRGATSFIQCNYTNYQLVYSPKSTDTKPSTSENILFLGLSYNIQFVLELCSENPEQNIYFIECDDYTKALQNEEISLEIPQNFKRLDLNSAIEILENTDLRTWEFYFYKQNLTLFPAFWSNILNSIEDILLKKSSSSKQDQTKSRREIFLAAYENDLLYKELQSAIVNNGYSFSSLPFKPNSSLSLSEDELSLLSTYLRSNNPSFFLSINGRFLDSNGRIFYLLEHLKIPVGIWIVDNVWNILSQFKNDFWKLCPLFVTDKSFIPQLQAHGAAKVHYMPLAGHYHGVKERINKDISTLYVGYSEFKNKHSFFAAVKKDVEILDNFKKKADASLVGLEDLANFHSIYSKLLEQNDFTLWPRNDFRQISYISAEIDIYHKRKILEELAKKQSLTIIGDEGWQNILGNNLQILKPVDYYTQLQEIYAKAKFTLNIPSLLMPSALTQRHFDVWLAYGFLFSLPTQGLDIFPQDLQDAFCAKNTDNINNFIDLYSTNISLYMQIQSAMRAEIDSKHLYIHRIQEFIKILLG